MSEVKHTCDCLIIGAGLAGLSLAIQLADQHVSVVVVEKKQFPFHKVCGEYISMESWDFIKSLGLDLDRLKPSIINQLTVTANNGYKLSTALPLGGFGISRYTLDNELKEIAEKKGVLILDKTSVTNVVYNTGYIITTTSPQHVKLFSTVVIGAYGKYTPKFISEKASSRNEYIAVKYHIKMPFAADTIELHNFKNGYCGVSMVDQDTLCLCYLSRKDNLLASNNSIKQMEQNILFKNPFLKEYFAQAQFLYKEPLVISKIYFGKKTFTNSLGVLPLGDAAGTIAPLCGNGMSMALLSSSILKGLVIRFLKGEMDLTNMMKRYELEWNNNFKGRIATGEVLQNLMGNNMLTFSTLIMLKCLPHVLRKVISLTHGNSESFQKYAGA